MLAVDNSCHSNRMQFSGVTISRREVRVDGCHVRLGRWWLRRRPPASEPHRARRRPARWGLRRLRVCVLPGQGISIELVGIQMWLSPGRSPGVPYSSKSPNAYKQKLGYGGGGECPGQGDPAPRARRINPRRCDGQCRPSGLVRGPNPEPLLGTLAWIITGKRSTFEPRGEKVSVTPVPADVPASWSPPGGVSRLRYLPALAVWQSGRGPSGSVPCDGAPSNRTSAGNDQECNEQNLLLLNGHWLPVDDRRKRHVT